MFHCIIKTNVYTLDLKVFHDMSYIAVPNLLRQTDKQSHRATKGQTDKQTDGKTDRQRDRKSNNILHSKTY